jgi:hypothetical protein
MLTLTLKHPNTALSIHEKKGAVKITTPDKSYKNELLSSLLRHQNLK